MQKRLLIIGFVWPEPNATAAGSRMLQLIQFFLKKNYKITFASTASKSNLSFKLEDIGVSEVGIKLNNTDFDYFIKEQQPEIVLFDRFLTEEQFGWRVAENAPNAIRILDTEDLHSLRTVREQLFKTNTLFSIEKWLTNDITKREIASIYRCDLSLIISTYEIELLQTHLKIDSSLLLHLPFMLAEIDIKTVIYPSFEDRKDFICIGNGKHAPNRDAVLWLKNEIWPLIRKQLPNSNIHIYGAYLPQHIIQMHKPQEGFMIHGYTDNLETVMQEARLNLAPLRFGAGIKGKLADAMCFGLPSITTAIGAEGMHENLAWNGEIADNAIEFANAAVSLYTNIEKWKKAQQNGFKIINQLYNTTILSDNLASKLEHIQFNIIDHRNDNFIGAMLLHESMKSTKYMSKWIEEKNNSKS